MDLVALIPSDLADLLPAYRENRARELELLRAALKDNDLATVQQLGEQMYGVGNPYGFRQVTTFGRMIREACAIKDKAALAQVLDQYAEYLGKVTITIVAEPVPRPRWKKFGVDTVPPDANPPA